MTPLDFSRWYEFDEQSLEGGCFASSPLSVEEGERVGVVCMSLGGPETLDDVESFLYSLLMDPAMLDLPVGGGLRHWCCRLLSSYQAESVREEYELIGGSSPLNALTREQAGDLEAYLNRHYGDPTGVDFRTYVGLRHASPSIEDAAARMAEDGVDRVVLLPLYPQYSVATSGSALAYWKALEDRGDIASRPTTAAFEYAANPKFIQALSELIDEGLQRFPRDQRADVQLLFSAHGTPLHNRRHRKDPYCCLVHSTVQQVMQHRGHDRPYHTAFQNRIGLRKGLSPTTGETIERLAQDEVSSLLMVPVSFVTDHLQTSYGLDIALREHAETVGIHRYEVTSGLNTHPLFIEALSEATIAQLTLPVDVNQLRVGGDGLAQDYPLRPLQDLPRHEPATDRCPSCQSPVGARRWTVPDGMTGSEVQRPGEDEMSTSSAEH